MTIGLWWGLQARESLGCMKRSVRSMGSVVCFLSFSTAWASAQTPPESPAPREAATTPSPNLAAFVNVGFSHWFGETFGAPAGMTTPALVVGVRPGFDLLEVRAHYTLSLLKHELPSTEERSLVGFANLDVLFNREVGVAGERMMLQCGPSVGFVHTSQGVGLAYGAAFAARYMIDMGEHFALGPFFDVRWQSYDLPGRPKSRGEDEGALNAGSTDAQSHLGVALGFW